jgi:hypothetical protein
MNPTNNNREFENTRRGDGEVYSKFTIKAAKGN